MNRPVRAATVVLTLFLAAACGHGSDKTAAPRPSTQSSTDPGASGGPDTGVVTGPATGGETATTAAPPSGAAPAPGPATTPSPAKKASSTTTVRAGQAANPGGSTVTSRAAGSTQPAQPASPAPGTPAPGPAAPAVGAAPVDRTGVTDTKIRVGIHAPITGAAPVPQSAFDKGKDVYWKHIAEKGGIFGRNVEVVFRDDQFNPSRAVQVCRELVEKEKVFALFGAAGSEQITACARYADSAGVPYFSAGVNEDGLQGLRNYFAVSQTYAQQSPILASLVKNRLHKTKIAIVLNNTPALNETQQSMTAQAQAAGLNIVRNSRIGKNASDSELLSEANALRTSGAEVVYILTAPVQFIKLATNAQAQAYNPIYIGPGVTNGLNVVAEAGCPGIGAAKFLSPFPQLDVIDRLDPDYQRAYQKYNGSSGDDIGIAEWGLSKVFAMMLQATGRDLSRQSLETTMVSGQEFNSNVYPIVSYTGSIRFGARSSHLLEADCRARQYKTLATFTTGF